MSGSPTSDTEKTPQKNHALRAGGVIMKQDKQKPNLDYENSIRMSNTNRVASQRPNVNHKTKKNELK